MLLFRPSSDPSKERESLLTAIKSFLKEVLNEENEDLLVIRVKSERWNGDFVELHVDMVVENNSVLYLSIEAQDSGLFVVLRGSPPMKNRSGHGV